MHTGNRIVSVAREQVSAEGDISSFQMSNSGASWQTRYEGGKTPIHGAKTPAYGWSDSNSNRTPAWDASSKTPAWDVSSKTPAWDAGSKTPAWDAGSKTPGWGDSWGSTSRATSEYSRNPQSNNAPAYPSLLATEPTHVPLSSSKDSGSTGAWEPPMNPARAALAGNSLPTAVAG